MGDGGLPTLPSLMLSTIQPSQRGFFRVHMSFGGFIKGILRGVRCTKSLRVLFLHRRSPSWTTLVLYSRAVFIFNEPAFCEGGEILSPNLQTFQDPRHQFQKMKKDPLSSCNTRTTTYLHMQAELIPWNFCTS
jgi:hypothetical protein